MRLPFQVKCKRAHVKYIKFLIVVVSSLLFSLLLIYDLPYRRRIIKTNKSFFNVSAFLDSSLRPAVEPTLIIKKCKNEGVDVLVGIPSAPGNFKARNAVRNSWAKYLPPTWILFFVFGTTNNAKIQSAIIEESITFGDVYQANDFQDSYQNLTLKILSMLKWSNQHCQKAQYILKIDDDVFINLPRFKLFIECLTDTQQNMYGMQQIEKLVQDNKTEINGIVKGEIGANCEEWKPSEHIHYFIDSITSRYESYAFGGYLYSNVKPDRNPNSKWVLTKELYPEDTLPPFLSGTAYFFSANLLPYILNEARQTPLLPLEDVYLTGMIGSSRLNYRLSNVAGWSRFRPWFGDACVYSKLMTAHGLNPKELVHITEAVDQLNPESCHTMYNYIIYSLNDLVYYVSK